MNNNLYSLKVLREGLLTTIQDFGFKNLQHYGIPNGGAIDNFSYQLGNKIISNKFFSAYLIDSNVITSTD